MKIIDSFNFFNEIDLCLIRMEILSPYVDTFVITECSRTFSGKPKGSNFRENELVFDKFKNKIVYNWIDQNDESWDSWNREIFQRNSMAIPLSSICSENDIVITGDLDEVPDLEHLVPFITYDHQQLIHPLMKMYYYYLNLYKENGWHGSKICSWKYMKGISIDNLRNMKNHGIKIPNTGWHWSFLSTPDKMAEKIGAFSHTEFDVPDIKNNIAENVRRGKDLFFRGGEMIVVPIDESFPSYIRNNQKLWSKYIKEN